MLERMRLQTRLMKAVAVAVVLSFTPTRGAGPAATNATILGPNVHVFDPSTPTAEIERTAVGLFAKMEANQFGSERYALLFRPGKYAVNLNVGFYTQVAGLGKSPDDVLIQGGVNVDAQWLGNANATCNFWRTIENLSVKSTAAQNVTRIAVSQAAPLRRLHILGDLHLFAFDANMNAGWASGGFLADSVVDGAVVPASQQQWMSRNSRWGRWNNGVWNMVFVGCENAPSDQFPDPPYTAVNQTPLIREKPYLTVDRAGAFSVFVPKLQRNTQGVSWAKGPTPGTSLPMDQLHVARPDRDTASTLNAALEAGKHLLITPGIYKLDAALRVTRPNTVVLGIGIPSLIPIRGTSAIQVADVDGVTIAGLILDAGPVNSPSLLEVGSPARQTDHAANPTFLYDLTVRTGGTTAGRNNVGIVVHSHQVVMDQIWIWRADHGNGVGWSTNPTRNGLVVNGNDVIAYGLFNEHHEEYQTLWNGEGGRVYMYQSEMPYDVPDQKSWMSGNIEGFASYKVAKHVTRHEAWGLGVYAYFRDAPVMARSAIEAPDAPGVQLHNLTTIWLNGQRGSEIRHVVNDRGGRVYGNRPASAMRQTVREFGGSAASTP